MDEPGDRDRPGGRPPGARGNFDACGLWVIDAGEYAAENWWAADEVPASVSAAAGIR